MTKLREHGIDDDPPPAVTRYTRNRDRLRRDLAGLTPEARVRIGIDREPLNWGDMLVYVLVGTCILYPIAKWALT